MTELFTREHFERVLAQAKARVFNKGGKGYERHGLGKETPLEWQPVFIIAKKIGPQFMVGQAMKKLMELEAIEDPEAKRQEELDILVYVAFDIMWSDYCREEESKNDEDSNTSKDKHTGA